MEENELTFKIVLIGSVGTGKTNIANRYIKDEFKENPAATVGVQFMRKTVSVGNRQVKITLWDTAGQERYKSLSKVYYKGASGVLIVYDTTNLQSYLDVESWLRLVNENLNLSEVAISVVGNKIDLQSERKVPKDRPVKEYKNKFDFDCDEVSAKTGANIDQVFSEMLARMYEKHMDKQRIYEATLKAEQEQNKKRQAQTKEEQKIAPTSIKKQPQIKNKNINLEGQSKKREREKKDKKKGGCC